MWKGGGGGGGGGGGMTKALKSSMDLCMDSLYVGQVQVYSFVDR